MIILGAGMAGCIAAILNPKAQVLEGANEPPDNHNAVLRFRNDNISKVTGIPFKKVKVRKALFYHDHFFDVPNPQLANLYSQKVIGAILPRSVWDLETVERYIAPPDFHMQLLDMIEARVEYGIRVNEISASTIYHERGKIVRHGVPIISTIPMPVMVKAANVFGAPAGFEYQSIYTERWHILSCDAHQTIYFPDPDTPLYRATLTGSELILEATRPHPDLEVVACYAFGINPNDATPVKRAEQKYGKIAPVDDHARKLFMFNLSQQLGIYSLGRFACWRNILLDDVYEDVFKIRRMIKQSPYDVRKEL